MKNQVRRLIGSEQYYRLRTRKWYWSNRLQHREPLFVHQMGKVGSTTIVNSLKALGLHRQYGLYQTHFMSAEGNKLFRQLQERGFGGVEQLPRTTVRSLAKNQTLGQILMSGYLQRHPVKVVTLVRDPIATNLSGLFHNYHWWPATLQAMVREQEPGWQEALKEHFLDNYPHDVPLKWFDLEMKSIFGIDVFAVEFPKELGYQILQHGKTDLLILKLETMEDCASNAFSEFLGVGNYTTVNKNRSEAKWYSDTYRRFRSTLTLPSSYVNSMFTPRYTRHFYTDSEIFESVECWTSYGASTP